MHVDAHSSQDVAGGADRLREELATLAQDGPLAALRTLADITRWADELARTAVAHARARGASWTAVGAAVGTSRQAAFERFRHVAPAAPATPVTPAASPAAPGPAATAPSEATATATTATGTDGVVPARAPSAGQPAHRRPQPQPAPPPPPPQAQAQARQQPTQQHRAQPQFAGTDTSEDVGVGLLALDGLVDLVAARQAGCPACSYWTWRPCDEHLPTELASTPAHPPRWTDGDAVEVRPVRRKATVATLAGWRAHGRGGRWVYRVDFSDDGIGRPGPAWWDEKALRRARPTPTRRDGRP